VSDIRERRSIRGGRGRISAGTTEIAETQHRVGERVRERERERKRKRKRETEMHFVNTGASLQSQSQSQ